MAARAIDFINMLSAELLLRIFWQDQTNGGNIIFNFQDLVCCHWANIIRSERFKTISIGTVREWVELGSLLDISTDLAGLHTLIRNIIIPADHEFLDATSVRAFLDITRRLNPYAVAIHHQPSLPYLLSTIAGTRSSVMSLAITLTSWNDVRLIDGITNLRTLDVTFSESETLTGNAPANPSIGFFLANVTECSFHLNSTWPNRDTTSDSFVRHAFHFIGQSRLPALRRLAIMLTHVIPGPDDVLTLHNLAAHSPHMDTLRIVGASSLICRALDSAIVRLNRLELTRAWPGTSEQLLAGNDLPASWFLDCDSHIFNDFGSILDFLATVQAKPHGLEQGFEFVIRERDEWETLMSPDSSNALNEDLLSSIFFKSQECTRAWYAPPMYWSSLVRGLQQCRGRLLDRGVEMKWTLQLKSNVSFSCSSHKYDKGNDEELTWGDSQWRW